VFVDDTFIEVHGYAKRGSGCGYSGVRGLNALLATATTKDADPVVLAQRLRKGAAVPARGEAPGRRRALGRAPHRHRPDTRSVDQG
jgi:hypothetical protein